MSQDDLINNGLEAAGFPRDANPAYHRAKDALALLPRHKNAPLTEDKFTRLIDQIEHNAEKTLTEIKFLWSPHEPRTSQLPPPPEWLRPAWKMARYQYARQTIVRWVEDVKEARKAETPAPRPKNKKGKTKELDSLSHKGEAPRRKDVAEKLNRLSRKASSLVALLQDPYVEQLVGDHIEALRDKTLGKPSDKPPPVPDAQILERAPHKRKGSHDRFMLPEQSLPGLWHKPLVRCLEELALTAAAVSADPQLKDVGGNKKTAWTLRHLPVKVALLCECWGLIDGLGFEKPTNPKIEGLAQAVWELAGYDAGKSFERPLKQMRANIKEVTANEMLAGRHLLILSDPWAVKVVGPE